MQIMSVVTMKQLLEAGFILSSDKTLEPQNGSLYFYGAQWYYIIDLQKTVKKIEEAAIKEVVMMENVRHQKQAHDRYGKKKDADVLC